MNPIFSKQTALVTGAAIGIGFAIARQLGRAGARIVLNDVDEQAAAEAARQLRSEQIKVETVIGNAGDRKVIDQMIRCAIEKFGQLDLVIANAGITTFGDFLNYTESDFHQLIDLNLKGSFFLTQAAARQFIRQQSAGRILLMSSVTGHQAHPQLAAYGMTKAALEMLAKSLAVELAPHRITVNAIAPGATLTERTRQLDPNYQQTWERITPSGQVCTPEDIARTALFLLDPAAGQITGQTIVVDGGWTSVSPPPET